MVLIESEEFWNGDEYAKLRSKLADSGVLENEKLD
jgi:hypothetical protein